MSDNHMRSDLADLFGYTIDYVSPWKRPQNPYHAKLLEDLGVPMEDWPFESSDVVSIELK